MPNTIKCSVDGLAKAILLLRDRHVSPELLAKYVQNREALNSEERDQLEDHLAICEECEMEYCKLKSRWLDRVMEAASNRPRRKLESEQLFPATQESRGSRIAATSRLIANRNASDDRSAVLRQKLLTYRPLALVRRQKDREFPWQELVSELLEKLYVSGGFLGACDDDLRVAVSSVLIRFAIEGEAGALVCLDFHALRDLTAENISRKYRALALFHCCEQLYRKLRGIKRTRKREVKKARAVSLQNPGQTVPTSRLGVARTEPDTAARVLPPLAAVLRGLGVSNRIETGDRNKCGTDRRSSAVDRGVLLAEFTDRWAGGRAERFPLAYQVEGQLVLEDCLKRVREFIAEQRNASGPPPDIEQVLVFEAERLRQQIRKARWRTSLLREINEQVTTRRHARLDRPLMKSINECWKSALDRKRQWLETRLAEKLAAIAEKYLATSAWLFLKTRDRFLEPRCAHNSNVGKFEVPLKGKSIVAHVYACKKPHLAGDVRVCKYYRKADPETRSEMAVPVILRSDPAQPVLAVLNVESNKPEKFHKETLDRFALDADDFVVDLLCLQAMDSEDPMIWPWHPAQYGGFGDILKLLCQAITRSGNHDIHLDNMVATTWLIDVSKRLAFVPGVTGDKGGMSVCGGTSQGGTSGYDFTFISDQVLTEESLTYSVAGKDSDQPEYTTPDDPRFVEWQKADDMGISEVISVPIRRPNAAAREPGFGTLNVYLLRTISSCLLPGPEEMQAAARTIGALWSNFEAFRDRILRAHASVALRRASELPGNVSPIQAQVETMQHILTSEFAADGASTFVKRGLTLLCLETTGIEPPERKSQPSLVDYIALRSTPRDPIEYDASEERDVGIMTFLWMDRDHDECVRKHDAFDIAEAGVPRGLPKRVVTDKNLERLLSDRPNKRRLLAVSITDAGKTLGVLRIVRAGEKPPFWPSDEQALRSLAELVRPIFVELHRQVELSGRSNPTQRSIKSTAEESPLARNESSLTREQNG